MGYPDHASGERRYLPGAMLTEMVTCVLEQSCHVLRDQCAPEVVMALLLEVVEARVQHQEKPLGNLFHMIQGPVVKEELLVKIKSKLREMSFQVNYGTPTERTVEDTKEMFEWFLIMSQPNHKFTTVRKEALSFPTDALGRGVALAMILVHAWLAQLAPLLDMKLEDDQKQVAALADIARSVAVNCRSKQEP